MIRKAAILFFALVLTPLSVPVSAADQTLSEEAIQERFEQIGQSYDLYEPLNKEDAAFVKKYAKFHNNRDEVESQMTFEKEFSKQGKNTEESLWLWITGELYAEHDWFNNVFGKRNYAYITWNDSDVNVSRLDLEINHQAFGVIGSGGIGKVYDGTLTSHCEGSEVKFCALDGMKDYVAYVIYSYTSASATATYNDGRTLTVTAAQ